MHILAIETSCDETALALIEAEERHNKSPRFAIKAHYVSSQVKIHEPFGGVVPSLAKREHLKNLPIILRKLEDRFPDLEKLTDCIAVTVGPGLEPALWTGINCAQDLKHRWKKPLIGVNHLEGHLYSFFLSPQLKKHNIDDLFPCISLIISGGHTLLLCGESLNKWKKIGETRDDAAGEAFDKVAKMLGLPYPGGPILEKLAEKGNLEAINFPRPMIYHKNYDFSFSGLKTAVLYYIRSLNEGDVRIIDESTKADIAASFEKALIDVITHKTKRALVEYNARSLMLSGGVAANEALRASLSSVARTVRIPFMVAPSEFNTDNAVMIGVAGYMKYISKKKSTIKAQAHLTI